MKRAPLVTEYAASGLDEVSPMESATHPSVGARDSVIVPLPRVRVAGKFLFVGDTKFWVKGVTYGTFAPGEDGHQFPGRAQVEQDFSAMAAAGLNAVRTYTVPPVWLMDLAQDYGLRVMVGLPWEQHITFLDGKNRRRAIIESVREGVRSCANHQALLCFAVGNEIPPPIVRWYGRRRIERFIRRLYDTVKQEDPAALVTYVNFPTTEYLELPFLDICCFNVYLESRERLEAYLARLQNLAGERPLLMAEIGLDSRRNGDEKQAEALNWQLRSAFAEGCVGTFVFAWTDEWYRGGHDIDDWDFGLTTRERCPKLALETIRQIYASVPFPADMAWPRISVVVCSFNGASTIRDTLDALARLEYPNFEVIVVNDGSTDRTGFIASEYDVRLISTENRGLSNARNTGWREATGEIVAYIDDDAYPDPHWLQFLAYRFMTTDYVGVGGPNIAPEGDGNIADCVANAPGGPVHVLVSDSEAEHIPGCNMAFRREALEAIDGFDPRYRAAGDDVDLCWRLQQRGGRIGFHAGAMDWHHRRGSLAMYWRQQKGYGKAEALLEAKWPERYNPTGHLAWSGQLYGRGLTRAMPIGRSRIYGGVWGSAAYQSLYKAAPVNLLSLPLMPEWYLLVAALAALALLGWSWPPLLWAIPLLLLAVALPVAQAVLSAAHARFPTPAASLGEGLRRRALTAGMHLAQPLARLIGRLRHGLTPWRRMGAELALPVVARREQWRETWQDPGQWLEALEQQLRKDGVPVYRGGEYDPWDLKARVGTMGAGVALLAVEEHGAGRQLGRWRLWPSPSAYWLGMTLLVAALGAAAALNGAWLAASALGTAAAVLGCRIATDCGAVLQVLRNAVERTG
jgi:O-antigen biosynthesis protein